MKLHFHQVKFKIAKIRGSPLIYFVYKLQTRPLMFFLPSSSVKSMIYGLEWGGPTHSKKKPQILTKIFFTKNYEITNDTFICKYIGIFCLMIYRR